MKSLILSVALLTLAAIGVQAAAPVVTNIANFPSISVAYTNYVGEQIVTNGLSLGGTRETNWPSGTAGSTNVYVFKGKVTFQDIVNITTNVYVTNATIFINGTNVATINPTAGYLPFLSGTNFGDSPFFVTNTVAATAANLAAQLSVGDATWVDVTRASQTNQVAGAISISYATNGISGYDQTHVRWFFNSSGSDQTLTIPSGWRTNVYSAVPSKLTNSTITAMYVKCGGPTGTSAQQTNCYVSFEFYK